jgi:hypothetical protein
LPEITRPVIKATVGRRKLPRGLQPRDAGDKQLL